MPHKRSKHSHIKFFARTIFGMEISFNKRKSIANFKITTIAVHIAVDVVLVSISLAPAPPVRWQQMRKQQTNNKINFHILYVCVSAARSFRSLASSSLQVPLSTFSSHGISHSNAFQDIAAQSHSNG